MNEENHIVKIEAGIAQVFLNRTSVHNALDENLIADLAATFERLNAAPDVRIVQISGLGTSFCAGGDLKWMERTANYSFDENLADARRLAEMLQSIYRLSKPTMALVNGPAYGGGLGLIAACDIAIAVDTAKFSLSEVRLGLLPATIGPYVLRKIGENMARRYFLTGEVFEAADALRIGLVHEVVAAAELRNAAAWFVKRLREGGPQAHAAIKSLIARISGAPIDEALISDTAQRIATQRSSDEGKEGTRAFLEKRKPRWHR